MDRRRGGIVLRVLSILLVGWGLVLGAQTTSAAPVPKEDSPQPTHLTVAADAFLRHVRQVAAGAYHTCALLEDGSVRCWGYNGNGQLGNGSTTDSSAPVAVVNLGGRATAITAGGYHTCALLEDGSVRCWGFNYYGQLGNDTTTNSRVPVAVVNLGGRATAITAGTNHTCALLEDGSVRCWGENFSGQLGNGSTTNSRVPVSVVNLGGRATAITARGGHTCALLEDSRVRCWGSNRFGQLGNGTTTNSPVPVTVAHLDGQATAVVAGGRHTCALLEDSNVRCWGYNAFGQLGNDSTTNSSTPVTVTNLGGRATAITAGWGHTCALLEDGSVRCWGRNRYGQVGSDSFPQSSVPVSIIALRRKAIAIAAGDYHTCALLEDGSVRCWGYNAFGQLGNGAITRSSLPVTVFNLGQWTTAIAAGGFHTCALLEDGSVRCWGYNRYGQLGDGSTTSSGLPVTVVNLGERATAIAAGESHTCALLEDGSIQCWGFNRYGRLGNGSTTDSSVPVSVVNLGGRATAIAAGEHHTCALLEDGSVQCWGYNHYGQLGNDSTTNSPVPVSVVNLGGRAIAIASGGFHTCALLEDGSVRCWGRNRDGQLGDGSTTDSPVPVSVVNLGGRATAITAGSAHTCALLEDGSIRCWGENRDGQLGNNTTTNSSMPVTVTNLGGHATAIAAGWHHTCALLEDGSARCWGYNRDGQLGNGSTTDSHVPTEVLGVDHQVAFITTGKWHTCALLTLSQGMHPLCWGSDRYGQLGRGQDTARSKPVPVLAGPRAILRSTYPTGQPGSWFTLWGAGFPPNTRATVTANGQVLTTTLLVLSTGEFLLFLNTDNAPPGDYLLHVQAGTQEAFLTLRLTPQAPQRERTGDGLRLTLPANIQPSTLQRRYHPYLLW